MKKIISMLLLIAFAFGIVGCETQTAAPVTVEGKSIYAIQFERDKALTDLAELQSKYDIALNEIADNSLSKECGDTSSAIGASLINNAIKIAENGGMKANFNEEAKTIFILSSIKCGISEINEGFNASYKSYVECVESLRELSGAIKEGILEYCPEVTVCACLSDENGYIFVVCKDGYIIEETLYVK